MTWRRAALVGVVGGLMSGLLGIGGGIVMVPLLAVVAGLGQRDAHAVSLAAIIPISVAGIAVYGAADTVELVEAATLTVGAVMGAQVGTLLLARAPERVLKGAFGAFLLAAAALILVEG